MWVRSLFRFDWSKRTRKTKKRTGRTYIHAPRTTLMSDTDTPAPEMFPVDSMRAYEADKVRGDAANIEDEDRCGACVSDVDTTILRALEHHGDEGMSTRGTRDDPHWIIITGDAAGLTADASGMRVCIVVGSVERMNQSVDKVRNLAFYSATEKAEHYDVMKGRLGPVLPTLRRLFQKGELIRSDGSPSGIYIKFLLTGDKPFLCHCLGRRSLNHDCFS